MRSPSYDPTLWLLARDGGTPVGVLNASAGDDGGSVDWLAVLPSHRGRGLGTALLRRAFAAFAALGLRRVTLNVDAENPTGATGVYERVGMRVVNRWGSVGTLTRLVPSWEERARNLPTWSSGRSARTHGRSSARSNDSRDGPRVRHGPRRSGCDPR